MRAPFPVDLIVLWCDDSDTSFHQERIYWAEQCGKNTKENNICRFRSHDELRYMLRGVEQYLPWIRHVLLVTDGRLPAWLNRACPRLRCVAHSQFMPKEYLPVFNTNAIEAGLCFIDGLAEHFLLANDDTFVRRPLKKSVFFPNENTVNNYYVPCLKQWRKNPPESLYSRVLLRSYQLMKARFPHTPLYLEPHHNIDAYLKSVCLQAWAEFGTLLSNTQSHRFRQDTDISRWVFQAMSVGLGKGRWKKVSHSRWFGSLSGVWEPKQAYMREIQKYDPVLFCVNDSETTQECELVRLEQNLRRMFPQPSIFEKE